MIYLWRIFICRTMSLIESGSAPDLNNNKFKYVTFEAKIIEQKCYCRLSWKHLITFVEKMTHKISFKLIRYTLWSWHGWKSVLWKLKSSLWKFLEFWYFKIKIIGIFLAACQGVCNCSSYDNITIWHWQIQKSDLKHKIVTLKFSFFTVRPTNPKTNAVKLLCNILWQCNWHCHRLGMATVLKTTLCNGSFASTTKWAFRTVKPSSTVSTTPKNPGRYVGLVMDHFRRSRWTTWTAHSITSVVIPNA